MHSTIEAAASIVNTWLTFVTHSMAILKQKTTERLDPTDGLVQYVNSIKPYHSKLMDVLVEYVFVEQSKTKMRDSLLMHLEMGEQCSQLEIVGIRGSNELMLQLPSSGAFKRLHQGDNLTIVGNWGVSYEAVFTVSQITYHASDNIAYAMIDEPLIGFGTDWTNGFVQFSCPEVEQIEYADGYGLVWDPSDGGGSFPSIATIVRAVGVVEMECTVSGSTVAFTPHVSGILPQAGDKITFSTAAVYPLPVTAGAVYYVTSVSANSIQVSDTPGGPNIVFTSAGMGGLKMVLVDAPHNSFTIDPVSALGSITSTVTNTISNQLEVTSALPIISSAYLDRKIVTTGSILHNVINRLVYVNGSTDLRSNRSYTVTAVQNNVPSAGKCTITVAEPLSITMSATGYVNVPLDPNTVPMWAPGTAVRASSSSLPFPLSPTTTYYYTPSTNLGGFTLSTVRFPKTVSDTVDIVTPGTDVLTITKVEPISVGDTFAVAGSSSNNGTYQVDYITKVGTRFVLGVTQTVPSSTPPSATTDGSISSTYGTYGSPQGAVVNAPPLHTLSRFGEQISFEFDPAPLHPTLLDTFAGSLDLTSHVSDSGNIWAILNSQGTLTGLQIGPSGLAGAADVQTAWITPNWIVPAIGADWHVELMLTINQPVPTGSIAGVTICLLDSVTGLGPTFALAVDSTNDDVVSLTSTDTVASPTVVSGLAGTLFTARIDVIRGERLITKINGATCYDGNVPNLGLIDTIGFQVHTSTIDPTLVAIKEITSGINTGNTF